MFLTNAEFRKISSAPVLFSLNLKSEAEMDKLYRQCAQIVSAISKDVQEQPITLKRGPFFMF